MLLDGLAALLTSRGIEIVGRAADALEGLRVVSSRRPDVAIIDVNLPGMSGIAAARWIARHFPRTKAVMLSGSCDERRVIESMLWAKARGYVVKSDDPSNLELAISAVVAGKRYVSPSAVGPAFDYIRGVVGERPQREGGLSERERQVLSLVAEGLTAKAISARLSIAPKTVRVHLENVRKKLGLHSTAALTIYAIETGVIKVSGLHPTVRTGSGRSRLRDSA